MIITVHLRNCRAAKPIAYLMNISTNRLPIVIPIKWERSLPPRLPLGNVILKFYDLVLYEECRRRVCCTSCKSSCLFGICEPVVNIKNIECTINDHAFEQCWIKAEIFEVRLSKRVAIMGSEHLQAWLLYSTKWFWSVSNYGWMVCCNLAYLP